MMAAKDNARSPGDSLLHSESSQQQVIILTGILGLIVGVFVYLLYKLRNQDTISKGHEEPKKNEVPEPTLLPKPTKIKKSSSGKNSSTGRDSKGTTFSHAWLSTSLKGHTRRILDMDFNGNGKYLATTSEDGRGLTNANRTVVSVTTTTTVQQQSTHKKHHGNNKKKNHDQNQDSTKKSNSYYIEKSVYYCNNMTEQENVFPSIKLKGRKLYYLLQQYILGSEQLLVLGYPVESAMSPGQIFIFKDPVPVRDSDTSPPPGCDVKRCMRCCKDFNLSSYDTKETDDRCMFHWGRLNHCSPTRQGTSIYECCRGNQQSPGCSVSKYHVWAGIDLGMNGPLHGYISTKYGSAKTFKIFGLDCEMCYTTKGFELVRVSLVKANGQVEYDSFVNPTGDVIDYNTRFSGVCAEDMVNAKTMTCVQKDLLKLIDYDTILIGHGLENDLRALKLLHSYVVDTAVVFPHDRGLPFRRPLKSIYNAVFRASIQESEKGHSSVEDAKACMDVMLWKIQYDIYNPSYKWIAVGLYSQ